MNAGTSKCMHVVERLLRRVYTLHNTVSEFGVFVHCQGMEGICDYEKKRLENIRENSDILKTLG